MRSITAVWERRWRVVPARGDWISGRAGSRNGRILLALGAPGFEHFIDVQRGDPFDRLPPTAWVHVVGRQPEGVPIARGGVATKVLLLGEQQVPDDFDHDGFPAEGVR